MASMLLQERVENNENNELLELCENVRVLIKEKKLVDCENIVKSFICKYPHAPQPHNLYGILLEKEGNHVLAMKHFRAAWALDPTYLPVRYNLERFANMKGEGIVAYDENDIISKKKRGNRFIAYDENGIGHVIKGRFLC